MEEVGRRLRAERERSGLLQQEMALVGGVTVVSQRNYESGRRAPDAEYLARIAAKGVDVLYVLTGERPVGERLPERERDLVLLFREASEELRAAAIRMLSAGGMDCGPIAGGDVGQVISSGKVSQQGFNFRIGGGKKGGGRK